MGWWPGRRQGTTNRLPPGSLSDVFGFTIEDIQGVWDPLPEAGDEAGELWRCLIPMNTAGALLKGEDGHPVAVEHAFGKGRAIYYGRALTLAHLRRQDPRVASWIAAPALAADQNAPVHDRGPGYVAFRHAVINRYSAEYRGICAGRRTVPDHEIGHRDRRCGSTAAVEARLDLKAGLRR